MVPRFWKGCKFGCKNQNKDCAENCVRLVQNGNKAYGSIDSLSGDTFVEIVPSGAGRGSEGKISHPLRNLQAGKEYLVHFLLARRPDKTGSQDQLQANVKIGVLRPSLEHSGQRCANYLVYRRGIYIRHARPLTSNNPLLIASLRPCADNGSGSRSGSSPASGGCSVGGPPLARAA